jgi:large subunit ribosomal protein L25
VLGKKVKHLRKQGLIPATVYGKGVEPISIQMSDREFNLLYRKTSKTALIDLDVAGQGVYAVFVQDLQRHPVTRLILHADFKVVDLKKAVQIEVPISTIGESPLVARGDALLNHVLGVLLVEALPGDLPQHIEIDISGLTDMEKSIHVRDIAAQAAYKILADPDQVLLSLSQLRASEEAPAAAAAEPELIRKERESDDS